MISESFQWKLLESFFEKRGLVSHQIDTYDDFVSNGIERVVRENTLTAETSDAKYTYSFGEAYVPFPTVSDEEKRKVKPLLPKDARTMDLTYDSPVFIDVVETETKEGQEAVHKVHKRVPICRIPIMVMSSRCHLSSMSSVGRVQSGECERDPGGYFIIKGLERVLVGQLRGMYNQPVVLKQKASEKYRYICELRSMSDETGHSVLVQAKIGADDRAIVFLLPYLKDHIPVGVLFKSLGFVTEEEILSLLRLNNVPQASKYLRYIIRDSFFVRTQEDALKYMGQFPLRIVKDDEKQAYATQVVENELFPHMGVIATIKEKALLLGDMVNKLLRTSLGLRSPDDRDNYANKRIEMSGVLCFELFRTLFKKYIKYVQMGFKKKKQKPDILNILSRNTMITQGLRSAWSLGNWGVPKANYVRKGVSQVLQRLSYAAFISHLRRIAIQSGKDGKNGVAKIRQIHGSQVFFVCPSESPEGVQVGLVLNLALTSTVTRHVPPEVVKEIVRDCDSFSPIANDSEVKDNTTAVFLNGMIVGSTEDHESLIEELQSYRSTGLLHRDVSFVYNDLDQEVRIFCDEGRFTRPLFTLENGALPFREEDYIAKEDSLSAFNLGNDVNAVDWGKAIMEKKVLYENIDFDDFVQKRYIQYLDVAEIETKVLAMTPQETVSSAQPYDFLELNPAMMLGVTASTIPFADHIPGARTVFQSSMGKQGFGMHALSHNLRTDTETHVLNYPQRALVDTKSSSLIGYDEMLYGTNAIVAVLSMTHNQEDSIILNASSVQRGMFRSTTYKTVTIPETETGGHRYTTVEIPPVDKRERRYNYGLLDPDGIVRIGCSVKKDDVLVARTVVRSNKASLAEDESSVDASYAAKPSEEGVIDRIVCSTTPDGYKLIKIVIRIERVPEVGDKMCGRCAQKGTVGLMVRQEDMPFTSEGMVPDVVINSHCLPSRMTVSILLEGVLGKSCLLNGRFGDGTPFGSNSTDIAEKICTDLGALGYERTGTEVMYSGETGEEIPCKVFFGPVFYMRLKHLISGKVHSRSSGQVTSLTRQPLEGRSRQGGLRVGEMEVDALKAHGTSRFLKERLFEKSDPFQTSICDKCGNFATSPVECKVCETDCVSKVNMPYACKLLLMELNAMSIKTKIVTKQK